MNIEAMTNFFMWCTIINGALLVFWTAMCILAPDLVHRTQGTWFPMARETYDVVMYAFLGFFKIVFLVFNVVPWVSLLIIR